MHAVQNFKSRSMLAVFEIYKETPSTYEKEHFKIVVNLIGWIGATYDQYMNNQTLKQNDDFFKQLMHITKAFITVTKDLSLEEALMKIMVSLNKFCV